MNEPINLHTADMLGALFLALHPGGSAGYISNMPGVLRLRVPGCDDYLQATREPHWRVCKVVVHEPPEGVSYADSAPYGSLYSVADFQAAIRHCFRPCGDEHLTTSPAPEPIAVVKVYRFDTNAEAQTFRNAASAEGRRAEWSMFEDSKTVRHEGKSKGVDVLVWGAQ